MTIPKVFSKTFPTLYLDRIVLREFRESDNTRYLKLLTSPGVSEFLSDEDIPLNAEKARYDVLFWRRLFYNGAGLYWCISDHENDFLIGTIGYSAFNYTNKRVELSYELMPEYHRRGIMKMSVKSTLNFVFRNLQINRVEAKTLENNTASINLLQTFGFKKEGVLRQYRYIRGKMTNITMFSLLKSEFNCLIQ